MPQEEEKINWLIEMLKKNLPEEDVEEIINDYDKKFGDKDDLSEEKEQLENNEDNLSTEEKTVNETESPSRTKIIKSSKALTGWLIKVYIGESKEKKDKERRVIWGKLEDKEIYFREEELKNELKEEKWKKLLERPEFVVKNRINFAWDEGDNNEEILADESENVIWGVDEDKKVYFREGITEEEPEGTSWSLVNEEGKFTLKCVTIKDNQIWGIDREDNHMWVKPRDGGEWKKIVLENLQSQSGDQLVNDLLKSVKESVTRLEIIGQKLDNLDLRDFINLEYLDCSKNKLTGLDVSKLVNLKEINCSNNLLTSDKLNISGLTDLEKFSGKYNLFANLELFSNLKNLKHLELTDNDFPEQDLSIFSNENKGKNSFTNLESLWIGNHERGTAGDVYNRFYGSLEPLEKLVKLKDLEIGWTNINDGLRYLPESLETIWCYGEGKYKGYGPLENKSSKVVNKLRNFCVKKSEDNFVNWLKKFKKEGVGSSVFSENKDRWEEKYREWELYASRLKEWELSLDNQYDYKSWREDYKKQEDLVKKDNIYPNLSWREVRQAESLPLRLYFIAEKDKIINLYNKVISEEDKKVTYVETKEKADVRNYAIVSYVWGQPSELTEEDKKELDNIWENSKKVEENENGIEYKNELNPSGYKAWKKAIEVCKCEKFKNLGINYLWMDQLCVNQSSTKEGVEERNEEVPKMRQYYGDVYVTLIYMPINLLEELSSSRFPKEKKSEHLVLDWPKILEIVTNSEWFARSWTYQEGWLSKQTIFMFDDILIDGRFLSAVSAFINPNHTRYNKYKSLKEFNEYSKKIATPLGWTYYPDGYNSQDVVSLRLDEALREIKNRGRGVPVDGIYAILGLLPYGKDVKVNYKPRICRGGDNCLSKEEQEKQSKKMFAEDDYKWEEEDVREEWGIENKDCQHEEKDKKWPVYTKKDVEEALIEVMKAAIKNGYGEPLAWFGSGSKTRGRCWIPELIFTEDENAKWEEKQRNGSTKVVGGMHIKYIVPKDKSGNIVICPDEVIVNEGIKIHGSKYTITSCGESIDRVDEKSVIDGGLYRREAEVDIGGWSLFNRKGNKADLSLWGTRETLEKLEKGQELIIPNKNWKSKDGEAFAILMSGNHKIDLVRLGGEVEELRGKGGEKVTIGMDDKQSEQQYQAQIEISPKCNN